VRAAWQTGSKATVGKISREAEWRVLSVNLAPHGGKISKKG
jgi:hypothetical protein